MKLTRRLFLMIPGLVVPAAAQVNDAAFRALCMNHERPWNRFVRQLWGCPSPSGETTRETCKPANETLDLRAFNEAGEAAKKLWHLRPTEGDQKG